MWDLGDGGAGSLLSRPSVIGLALGAFVLTGWVAVIRLAPRFTPPNPRIIQGVLVVLILWIAIFPRTVGKAFDWVLENTVLRLMGANKSED
jgi:hypothetical protein